MLQASALGMLRVIEMTDDASILVTSDVSMPMTLYQLV